MKTLLSIFLLCFTSMMIAQQAMPKLSSDIKVIDSLSLNYQNNKYLILVQETAIEVQSTVKSRVGETLVKGFDRKLVVYKWSSKNWEKQFESPQAVKIAQQGGDLPDAYNKMQYLKDSNQVQLNFQYGINNYIENSTYKFDFKGDDLVLSSVLVQGLSAEENVYLFLNCKTKVLEYKINIKTWNEEASAFEQLEDQMGAIEVEKPLQLSIQKFKPGNVFSYKNYDL